MVNPDSLNVSIFTHVSRRKKHIQIPLQASMGDGSTQGRCVCQSIYRVTRIACAWIESHDPTFRRGPQHITNHRSSIEHIQHESVADMPKHSCMPDNPFMTINEILIWIWKCLGAVPNFKTKTNLSSNRALTWVPHELHLGLFWEHASTGPPQKGADSICKKVPPGSP